MTTQRALFGSIARIFGFGNAEKAAVSNEWQSFPDWNAVAKPFREDGSYAGQPAAAPVDRPPRPGPVSRPGSAVLWKLPRSKEGQ